MASVAASRGARLDDVLERLVEGYAVALVAHIMPEVLADMMLIEEQHHTHVSCHHLSGP
jgi:hypothetical protein